MSANYPSVRAMKDLIKSLGPTDAQTKWLMDTMGLKKFSDWNSLPNISFKDIAKTAANLDTNPFIMNPSVQAYCTAFMLWVRFERDLGIEWKDLKIADFTTDRRDELVNFYCDNMEFPTKDVDIPKAFTLMEGYEKWFEALNNKCSNTIGSWRFPIDYLLQDLTQKPPDADLKMETVQVRFYWLAQ